MKHAPNCMIGRMEWQNTRMHEMGCTCGAAQRDTPERSSGTAREAPGSEGPQGAARLPMTGDGAVVRGDHRWAKAWSDNMARRDNAALASSINVARAYLEQIELIEALRSDLNVATINVHGFTRKYHEEQAHALAQAAEIERLTKRTRFAIWQARAEASEARTADLLKALEPFAEIALSSDDEPDGPDMIDAPDLAITPTQVRAARAAIAAAKGETV